MRFPKLGTTELLLLGLGLVMAGSKTSKAAPSLRIPKDGPRFTLDELRAFAEQVGFADPAIAAAVAYAESSGHASAVGDNGASIGLWQIHTPSHPQYSAASLLDPNNNAAAALAISQGGTNWEPWTTFRTGAYQRYMPPAIAGAPDAAQLQATSSPSEDIDVAVPPSPVSEPAIEPAADLAPESELQNGEHVETHDAMAEVDLERVQAVEPREGDMVDGIGRVRVADEPTPRRSRRRPRNA